MTARAAAAVLGCALVLTGCGRQPAESESAPLTAAEFIDVMTELRDARLDLEGLGRLADSVVQVRYEEQRDRILEQRGITREDLHAFLDANPDLEFQTMLWDSITRRLKRPLARPVGANALPDSLDTRPDAVQRRGPVMK